MTAAFVIRVDGTNLPLNVRKGNSCIKGIFAKDAWLADLYIWNWSKAAPLLCVSAEKLSHPALQAPASMFIWDFPSHLALPCKSLVPAHLGVVVCLLDLCLPDLFVVSDWTSPESLSLSIIVCLINIFNNISFVFQWLHFCVISQVSWRNCDGKAGVKMVMVKVDWWICGAKRAAISCSCPACLTSATYTFLSWHQLFTLPHLSECISFPQFTLVLGCRHMHFLRSEKHQSPPYWHVLTHALTHSWDQHVPVTLSSIRTNLNWN